MNGASDEPSFCRSSRRNLGVQRQWCGRLGKIDNCQVGVYLGYVGGGEHALVDVRLYLPKEWAKDNKRRRQAGVPDAVLPKAYPVPAVMFAGLASPPPMMMLPPLVEMLAAMSI
ncbi:MAG: transposase [Gemmataceae bacterium]